MAKLKPSRPTATRIKSSARPAQRTPQRLTGEHQAAEPISEQAEPGVAAHQPSPQQARQLQWMQRTLGNAQVQRMLSETMSVPVQRAAAAAKPAAPQHDPRFQSLKARAAQAAAKAKQHPPARAKASEAQAAARGPANDVSSQAAAGHVKKMSEQKPGSFNKQAFIAALNQAIERITPRTQEQADEFKQSGKAGQLKDQVSSLVTKNKETSEHAIKTTTAAPPSSGNARSKSVMPLKPELTGAAPGSIGAASAMPANKTAAETSLAQSKQALDQQMATAQISEEQLKKSNEPAFTGALTAKKETEAHVTSAPRAFHAQEQTILGKARAEADVTANQALGGMQTTRTGALTRVGGNQTGAKTADEQKRAEVATRIETLFAKTKTDVTTILAGLDNKVNALFERGESAARAAFESHVQQQMAAYKKRRYSGPLGPALWLKDKIMPMPGEVNAFYQQGRQLYTSQMQRVISSVADVVAGELNRAKASIAQGRQSIQEYVTGLPRDLRQVGQEAAENIQGQFEQLEQDVTAKQDALVQTLAQKYVDARGAVDTRITEMQQANQGLLGKARAALGGVIQTILELKNMLLGVLGRASGVIGTIIKDPIRFLGNLVGAVKQGLHQFAGNISKHLQQGLMGWLFGALGQSGLQMPENLDMKGMLSLIVQVMGLTYANIRTRAVKLVGERTVGVMEGSVRVFQLLASEGPAGLWPMMQDQLGGIKDQVLDQIKDFVITRIITAGVTWLISLFNPASAFIKACKAIFDLIMFFIERGSQIMELANAIIDSVGAIATGSVGAAAGLIERTLGKALPVAISFLASLLGLGGIGQSIRKIIGSVQKPVNSAIDAVVKAAAKGFKKLSKGSKETSPKANQNSSTDKAEKQRRLEKAVAAAQADVKRYSGKKVGEWILKAKLFSLKTRYGLKSLEPIRQGQHWAIRGEINPVIVETTDILVLDNKQEAQEKFLKMSTDVEKEFFAVRLPRGLAQSSSGSEQEPKKTVQLRSRRKSKAGTTQEVSIPQRMNPTDLNKSAHQWITGELSTSKQVGKRLKRSQHWGDTSIHTLENPTKNQKHNQFIGHVGDYALIRKRCQKILDQGASISDLSKMMQEAARTGKAISAADLIKYYGEKKFTVRAAKARMLTRTAHLIFRLEPLRFIDRAKHLDHLPVAVSTAMSHQLLQNGNIGVDDVFAENASHNPVSGKSIAAESDKITRIMEQVRISWSSWKLEENKRIMDDLKKRGYVDMHIVPTRQAMLQLLEDFYGQAKKRNRS